MGNPYEQWPPQGGPPGQSPNQPYGQPPGPPYWGQQYGGPPPARRQLNLGGLDRSRIAAVVVAISGLIVLIGSFFTLYGVTVTPSALDVPDNDAPSGQVDVGIGFYDVFPIPPPIVAQAIPLLMVLATLTAVPAILGSGRRISGASAVFAGAASLLAFVLAVANPLPSIGLTGQLSAALEDEVGGQSVDQLVDSVVSIGPGAGLIVALVFSIIGWIAAALMAFQRTAPAPVQQPPPVPPRW